MKLTDKILAATKLAAMFALNIANLCSTKPVPSIKDGLLAWPKTLGQLLNMAKVLSLSDDVYDYYTIVNKDIVALALRFRKTLRAPRLPTRAYQHIMPHDEHVLLLHAAGFSEEHANTPKEWLGNDFKLNARYRIVMDVYVPIRDAQVGLIRGDTINHMAYYRNYGVFIFDGIHIVDLHNDVDEYGSTLPEFKSITEFPNGYWLDSISHNEIEFIDPRQLDVMAMYINVAHPPSDSKEKYSMTINGQQISLDAVNPDFYENLEVEDQIHVVVVRNPRSVQGFTYILFKSQPGVVTNHDQLYSQFLTTNAVTCSHFKDEHDPYLTESEHHTDVYTKDPRRTVEVLESQVLPKVLLEMISQYDV